MMVRTATPKDVPAIFSLIQELATYERAPEQVVNTPEQLTLDLFHDQICEALVACNDQDQIVALPYFTPPILRGKDAVCTLKIFMSWKLKESKVTGRHSLMKSLALPKIVV